MAEEREEISRLYGPPKITVVPHEGLEDGPPQLHVSRIPGQEIALSSSVWDSQRVQRRWLFGTHPEAFIGSSETSELLAEGLTQLMRPDISPSAQSLLTISQMADVTNHTRVVPVPVLAMATGESGELLRLSKIEQTNWQWGRNENPTLRMFSIDHHDREETVLWSSDGAPILQIKSALSLVRFEPTRWLLVQKKTSTTILQPEYHRVPVSERPPGIDKSIERPSRINPRPIMTISSEQSGGIAHSDVAFSHGSQRKPPQLAIIDECGYYSVWDIKGRDIVGSTSMRPKLRHCGHIHLGVQEQLPNEDSPAFRPESHGVLWIGPAGPGVDLWDLPTDNDADMGSDLAALTARSKKLLLWNRSKFEVIDIKDPSYRKSLTILKSDEPDYMLDVKLNPVNQSQVFILTSSSLFWIETSTTGTAAVKPGGISILQSFAHLRSSDVDSLRLTVHHGGRGAGTDGCTVYIYSEKSSDVEVYWFSIAEKTGLPQFEHHMMKVGKPAAASQGSPPKIHTLYSTPAYFRTQPSTAPKGIGAKYYEQHVGFHQLFILGKDLSLNQSLVAVSPNPDLDIVSPDNSREWSRDARRTTHNKRRKQFLQHFGDTFVVPDGLGDMDELVQRRANRRQELLQSGQGKSTQVQQRWPRVQNFDLLMSRVAVSLESVIMASEQPDPESPLSIFDAIQEAAINCLETEGGYIPLHLLHEYEVKFEVPPLTNKAIAAWDSRFRELLSPQDERVVAQPFTTQYPFTSESATPLADIRGKLEDIWSLRSLPPRAQQSRDIVLAETAEAIARSLFGVAVLDANLPTAQGEPPSWVPIPPREPEQPPSQRLSERFSLSPTKGSQPLSQRLSLSPTKLSQPSSQRLLLSPTKRSQLSSHRLSFSPSKNSRHQSPYPPSSSTPFPQSPTPFSQSSAPNSQASADSSEPTANALQRLSMLAADINIDDSSRQHPVLSFWPARRGTSTEGYVSSVLASSNKHLDAINERRQRAESRRRKRRSLFLGPTASSQLTSATATQDEAEDPLPLPHMEPATQPLPKLAPPIIGSSQIPSAPSSQAVFSSQMVPNTMSQPMSGRHGVRWSPKKKGKRKSGF
ncbi:hypothetical protein CCHL11_04208 [Colletotrichum chlorophyti]|uniref:Uncharacterized protein n=1 Tax=Colletotrichum chlorophyti TaxID=708187 RepID=A0A1Q8RPF8_9PEZI|nr:hypothetical protein CCHL11_04208 [Colletotrichum chlorophyti]